MRRRRSRVAVFGVGFLALLLVLISCYPSDIWRGSPSASGTSRPSPSRGESSGLNLQRVPWEGGPSYYARFGAAATAGWSDPSFFPIGVWLESVVEPQDAPDDKAMGFNTYIGLTGTSSAQMVRDNGMAALTHKPLAGYGQETVGWVIDDEPDMWAGAGDAKWTGNHPGEGPLCDPEDQGCGYTVMAEQKGKLPKDDRPHYANYGKGVMIWQTEPEAGKFVNGYTDIISADVYWYTSNGICEEAKTYLNLPVEQCRLSANYGALIDKLRRLDAQDGRLQPIYGIVEVGWPGADDKREIEPQQLAGAVMNSLIHEARGIIYFNHNFGGPCQSQHVLRDECGDRIRPTVVELNKRIRQLAPVLNSQSYKHTFNQRLDTMLKYHQGSYYVFAMLGRGAQPGAHTLELPPGIRADKAEVLFEGRTVPIDASGEFADTFQAEHSYHVYRIPAG
ncbi:hypothetical protein EDD27_9552 [Nonomuraea polychroma]|uniref:Uncharacterized protein n=1 Tax=Nonomuraea polychroma TaxID=46176 RepID=A0A438MLM8_9ACTN|nr:hypothetical protein [Nonomuraea polychroma]RVX46660.1 hypothetical protein EDD27_9552 [Nonomuraea polychroma]